MRRFWISISTLIAFMTAPEMAVAQSNTEESAQSRPFQALVALVDKKENIRTCEGKFAYLFDTSPETKQSIQTAFGTTEESISYIYDHWKLLAKKKFEFTSREAGRGKILNLKRTVRPIHFAQCDEDGIVSFENVAQGEYFLVIPVFWMPNPKKPRVKTFEFEEHINKIYVEMPTTFKGGVYLTKIDTASQATYLKKINWP